VTPLCSIKIGDVSADPPVIRVLVKGRRTQVVRVHPELQDLLQSYILSYTDLQGHSWLLAQPNGRPYNRKMVERLTRAWGTAATVPNCTPHRFRHTFATGLLPGGRRHPDHQGSHGAPGHSEHDGLYPGDGCGARRGDAEAAVGQEVIHRYPPVVIATVLATIRSGLCDMRRGASCVKRNYAP
jgi:hypothetical protein